MIAHKPSYRMECKDCTWWANRFFDQILPEECPRGHTNFKKHTLATGPGYEHNRQEVLKRQGGI